MSNMRLRGFHQLINVLCVHRALKEHQYDPEEEMMRTGYSCAPVSPSFWWQSEYACTVQAAILH